MEGLSISSARFEEDHNVDSLIADEIENIWSNVSKGISNVWLSSLDIPIAAELAFLKVKKIADWSVLPHDGLLPPPSSNGACLEKYVPEAEPEPVPIDTWARGAGNNLFLVLTFVSYGSHYPRGPIPPANLPISTPS
jgi:hypothetical protein